jgi:hypothetical protein
MRCLPRFAAFLPREKRLAMCGILGAPKMRGNGATAQISCRSSLSSSLDIHLMKLGHILVSPMNSGLFQRSAHLSAALLNSHMYLRSICGMYSGRLATAVDRDAQTKTARHGWRAVVHCSMSRRSSTKPCAMPAAAYSAEREQLPRPFDQFAMS